MRRRERRQTIKFTTDEVKNLLSQIDIFFCRCNQTNDIINNSLMSSHEDEMRKVDTKKKE
jgi:hypothetical protein